MNICSLIVHTKPMSGPRVSRHLQMIKGVEVHGGIKEDKLIVTVEDEGESISPVSDAMNRLREMDGIISIVLIYHYSGEESVEKMKSKIN